MDSRDGNGSKKNEPAHIEIVEITGSSGSSFYSGEDFPTSRSNQHPAVRIEVDDGSVGSSIHSGLVVDHGGRGSEDSDTHDKAIGGNLSSNPFEITPEFLQWWASGSHVMLQPDVMHESESRKQLEKNQDISNMAESDLLFPAKRLRSSSSSSSSSSHSKEDEFHMQAKPLNPGSGQASYSSGYKSSKSEGNENDTAGLAKSGVSAISHDSTAMKSPPVQVMDRSEGYDPNRVPASVFERHDSSTPTDWSVASNESLFSISVDNSFSKDPFRSGELLKSGELLPFSPSMVGYSPYATSPSMEADKKSNNLERNKAYQASSFRSDTKSTGNNQNEQKTTHTTGSSTSSNVSTHSSSMNSAQSFAFPILTDAARNNSLKGEPDLLQQDRRKQQQQQQQQQTVPEVTPKARTRKSWFSWCCCSPCRWTCSCRRWACSCHYCRCRHRCFCC